MHEFDDYEKINLMINNNNYELWVADSDEKKKLGLSSVKKLPNKTGIIFIYDKPSSGSFTIKKTSIPLTIIFLDMKGNTVYHEKCKPFQKKLVQPNQPYSYVIEI